MLDEVKLIIFLIFFSNTCMNLKEEKIKILKKAKEKKIIGKLPILYFLHNFNVLYLS